MSPYWTKRRDDVKDTAIDLSVYMVQRGGFPQVLLAQLSRVANRKIEGRK